jgi:imidazolonepropionase-like amidohydrolase
VTQTRQAVAALVAVLVVCSIACGQEPQRRGIRQLPEWAGESWLVRRHVDAPWALQGVNVIDVRTGAVAESMTVVIQGDLIKSVGDTPPSDGATLIDAEGAYVVPGFFDLHAHVMPTWSRFPTATEPEETLRGLLAAGVTSIRCIPIYSESASQWAGAVNAGHLTGPTITVTSSVIEQRPGRTFMGFGDPDTAASWVRKEALLGARWMKIYDNMDIPSLTAIIDTAAASGMRVCGHASEVSARTAAQLGMGTIEHITGIAQSCLAQGTSVPDDLGPIQRATWCWENADAVMAASLMETLREHRTGWVPTLVVTERIADLGGHDGRPFNHDRAAPALRQAMIRAATLAVEHHRAGGLVGVGTDFPVNGVEAGSSVHREMELFVELGGATPLEALQMATISSARILECAELLGTVEAGKLAHFVVLDQNPLVDISNVRGIRHVVHDGRLLEPLEVALGDD